MQTFFFFELGPSRIAYRETRLVRGSSVETGNVGRIVLIILLKKRRRRRRRRRRRSSLGMAMPVPHTYSFVKLAQLESNTSTPSVTLLILTKALLKSCIPLKVSL